MYHRGTYCVYLLSCSSEEKEEDGVFLDAFFSMVYDDSSGIGYCYGHGHDCQERRGVNEI